MITVVGGWPPRPVDADVLVGGRRLLDATDAPGRRVVLGDVDAALDQVDAALTAGERVCVLASGDPGFFGVVRALAQRFGRDRLRVLPGPSSVSVAFARLGLPWDDATVVSAHGRPLPDAARVAARSPKVAVLTAPDAPPAPVGMALLGLGAVHQHAAVCSRLGEPDEEVGITDLAGLAAGTWDPLSVVVLWSGTGVAPAPSLAWGLPSCAYDHRGGLITGPEVRAIVLGLLALPPPAGEPVLWDLGAGSGSVAVECAALAPWVEVVAVDRDPAAVANAIANARTRLVAIRAVTGTAPACLGELPDPDRVFVGGGGIDILRAAFDRLRPGGVIVATHAALDRAATAATMLGNLTAVTANRGRRLPDGGWRLEGANPVFVTWGSR